MLFRMATMTTTVRLKPIPGPRGEAGYLLHFFKGEATSETCAGYLWRGL